jgi:hypothetical protein
VVSPEAAVWHAIAQLDIMDIQEIATLEIMCVSSSKDLRIDEARRK